MALKKARIWAAIAAVFLLLASFALAGLPRPANPPYKIGMKRIHPVPLEWETLARGFERTVFHFEGQVAVFDGQVVKRYKRLAKFVVFRINTSIYPLRVVSAKSFTDKNTFSMKDVHERTGAILTINGGFFTTEGVPTGLVISDGKTITPYSEEGGSGVLAVYDGVPVIDWAANVATAEATPEQALQNGPLIIDPGGKFGINKIADHYFYRTIVGIDKKGRFLVGITRKDYPDQPIEEGLNLYEAAVIFYHPESEGGLDAEAVLNLDGGTSSGMRLDLGEVQDRIYTVVDVPNFICIMPPRR